MSRVPRTPQAAPRAMRRVFTRRNFLRAAGGGALALPLLDSLGARAADGDPFPKRLVLVYNPNGTAPHAWYPQVDQTETGFDIGKILEPLAHHRERMLLLKGINSEVGQDPANNGGPHQRGIGSLFTGQMLQTGEFRDGCGKAAGWADGISVDQAVANVIGVDTPFKSLELGVRASDNDVQGRISYAGAGKPLPPSNSPEQVYSRLFGTSAGIDPDDPNGIRRSVLSTVQEQFNLLKPKVGADDREKLEAHLELVREVERRLAIETPAPDGSCMPPVIATGLEANSEDDMPAISRAHLDLLAVAFACDLTRVGSIQYSTGFNKIRYPWLDSLAEGHSLSHSGDSNVEAWDELTSRMAWHAQELAYFLDKLASIPEGDGTVLDNTLVLWGNEVSKGNSHSLDDIPYLMLGNAGGALDSGRYLDFGGVSNCDLLLSVLHAMDVDADSFGHPDYCTGPLAGLLA